MSGLAVLTRNTEEGTSDLQHTLAKAWNWAYYDMTMEGQSHSFSLTGGAYYLPRITRRDGRAIESALAGPSLYEAGVQLSGAVVEATFAHQDPPLLRRLRDANVPLLVDPQTVRFTTDAFFGVAQVRGLPYAPTVPLVPGIKRKRVRHVVAASMAFQEERGASAYVAPSVPIRDQDRNGWEDLHRQMLKAAVAANGSEGISRKPLVAFLAPGPRALADPRGSLSFLADLPIDGVYVQPMRLDPTRDSVEKLVQYVRLLRKARELGIEVIASRVGAFGLILHALDIPFFDSGLGEAEKCDLAALNRPRRPETAGASGRKGNRRIYLEALRTTLPARVADSILAQKGLRARFACGLACCRWHGYEDLAERGRTHYLWVRHREVAYLAEQPTPEMKIDAVANMLAEAQETAKVVKRALGEREVPLPSFDHLDRWHSVLARSTQVLVETS